jgi:TonB family protein
MAQPAVPVTAPDTDQAAAPQTIAFDIPALPLEQALQRYGRTTRQPALFSSDMVAGLVSSPVRGRHSASQALRLLLQGTGLSSDRVETAAGTTFLLRPATMTEAAAPAPRLVLDGFAGLLQSRTMQVLCADLRTRPGTYRVLFQFALDASGAVDSARLLDSSGDAGRDAVLLAALRRLRLDVAPPAGFVGQPLTMALAPTPAGAASPCG